MFLGLLEKLSWLQIGATEQNVQRYGQPRLVIMPYPAYFLRSIL